MTKNSSKLESLFCGILFCISIAALVIACLAYTKKKSGIPSTVPPPMGKCDAPGRCCCYDPMTGSVNPNIKCGSGCSGYCAYYDRNEDEVTTSGC